MALITYSGKVIFAGAGCGDPDLITIKTAHYLQQADVVITDRLVSPVILQKYVNPQAKLIYVSKEHGNIHSTSQEQINQLLLEYTIANQLVVRLKGGDVSVFANLIDEIEILRKHEISYEIVPGITAAIGAAAFCGIPLTARRGAQAVRFITMCHLEKLSSPLWQELAATEDTLVLYMSSRNLKTITRQLVGHKIHPDKQMAVIEQATTPNQKVTIINIHEYAQNEEINEYVSPTLIIIGDVVKYHQNFAWFKTDPSFKHYFPRAGEEILNATA